MKELLKELEKSYTDSLNAFNELDSKFNDEDYDEDYDDTITRKYQEGYSDALNMVIQLLQNKGE